MKQIKSRRAPTVPTRPYYEKVPTPPFGGMGKREPSLHLPFAEGVDVKMEPSPEGHLDFIVEGQVALVAPADCWAVCSEHPADSDLGSVTRRTFVEAWIVQRVGGAMVHGPYVAFDFLDAVSHSVPWKEASDVPWCDASKLEVPARAPDSLVFPYAVKNARAGECLGYVSGHLRMRVYERDAAGKIGRVHDARSLLLQDPVSESYLPAPIPRLLPRSLPPAPWYDWIGYAIKRLRKWWKKRRS
jgi:hypothetical protein